MSTIDIVLSVSNVLICLFGLILCLYVLMSSSLNDKNRTNITALCLVGFGWAIFLYASIDLFEAPQVFYIIGRSCFLLGILVWAYKNILQLQLKAIREDL